MSVPDGRSGAVATVAHKRLGLVFALIASSFYGMSIVLARVAFDGGANPSAVLEVRFVVVAVTMAAVLRLSGRSFVVPKYHRWRVAGACLGVFGVAMGYVVSILFIPVSLAALIFYTFPLIVAAVVPALERAWPRPALLAAFPIAFAGLALALGTSLDALEFRGVALAFLAAVSGAFIFIVSPKAVAAYGVIGVSFYMGLGNAILLLAVIVGYEGIVLPVTTLGWTGLIGVSAFYVCANLAMFAALRSAGATTSALVFNLEPLVAIAGAAILLGERLSLAQSAGVALVIGALMLATLGRSRG
jgi:drug/metabolite transporter (DMT)-like permease